MGCFAYSLFSVQNSVTYMCYPLYVVHYYKTGCNNNYRFYLVLCVQC